MTNPTRSSIGSIRHVKVLFSSRTCFSSAARVQPTSSELEAGSDHPLFESRRRVGRIEAVDEIGRRSEVVVDQEPGLDDLDIRDFVAYQLGAQEFEHDG